MSQAEVWLELRRNEGDLDEAQFRGSVNELTGLFELFQDDDVLGMFEMAEPADAALANHDPINEQMGVVDQRLEAWFEAFGWTAPTGYLHGPRPKRLNMPLIPPWSLAVHDTRRDGRNVAETSGRGKRRGK
jgi:hypothetical protein